MEPQTTPSKSKLFNLGSLKTHQIVKFCLIFVAIVLILVGIYHSYGLFGKNKPFYTVVVDCGSTGTRLNVYEWKISDERNVGLPILLHSFPHESAKNPSWKNGCEYHCMQTEPGLDKFVGNYSGVRASLVPLLRWAERVIPNDRYRDTPIFVLATAGLRRLGVEDCTRVLEDVERVVKEYKFKWRRDWIRVLGGREEAYYGWVALNYRMGYLNKSLTESPTLGLLDLGGSSLQIVVEANEVREDRHLLVSKIGLVEHQLMAYSLPAFGLNKAFDRTVAMLTQVKPVENDVGSDVRHPCLNSKFVSNYTCSGCSNPESLLPLFGDPDWGKCRIVAQAAATNTSISDWSKPGFNSSCPGRSTQGKNVLNVAINTKTGMQYHALSGFFAVYKKLNLTAKANLTKILETAQHLCSSTWDDESNVSGSQYCFKVLYLASLIEDGLCLGNADIIFGPGDISWTLGASLVEGERTWRTAVGPRTLITSPRYMEIVLSSIFLFILLVVLAYAVYYCQIKLPMPRKRSAIVGVPLPSFTYTKHRPS